MTPGVCGEEVRNGSSLSILIDDLSILQGYAIPGSETLVMNLHISIWRNLEGA